MRKDIDIENLFYWQTDKSRLNKALAQYEIYKKIKNLPGDIVELGVFKGCSFIRFLNYRDCLETEFSRKVLGFDCFGDFPKEKVGSSDDLKFIDNFTKEAGRGLSLKKLEEILKNKNFKNWELIKGNVFETVPNYLKENPHLKISLLHLDMDVKEPTYFSLNKLYENLVPGGIIVIDDYNCVAGATEAVDKFVTEKKLKLKKLNFYKVPSIIIKDY